MMNEVLRLVAGIGVEFQTWVEILLSPSSNWYSLTSRNTSLGLSFMSICFVIRTIVSSTSPKRIFRFIDEQLGVDRVDDNFFLMNLHFDELEELNDSSKSSYSTLILSGLSTSDLGGSSSCFHEHSLLKLGKEKSWTFFSSAISGGRFNASPKIASDDLLKGIGIYLKETRRREEKEIAS